MTFSLVTLASMGLDWIIRSEHKNTAGKLLFRLLLSVSSVFFLVAFGGLIGKSVFQGNPYFHSSAVKVFFTGGIILTLSALLIISKGPGKIPLSAVLVLLILGAFNDVRVNDRVFVQPIPIEPYHRYLFQSQVDNVVKTTAIHMPARLLEMDKLLSMRMIPRNIANAHGYHPVGFKRYFDLIKKYWFDSGSFLRLFYITHIAGSEPEKYEGLNYNVVAKGEGALSVVQASRFEFPYMYAPERIRYVAPGKALEAMPDDINPYKLTVVETNDESLIGTEKEQDAVTTAFSYDVKEYSQNRVALMVSAGAPCTVVLSEPYFTGWWAFRNRNEALSISFANHLFRSIDITSSPQLITFIYWPFSFAIGLYLSLAAMVIVLATILFPAAVQRLQEEAKSRKKDRPKNPFRG
jgi:hypothetical protein